MAERYSARRRLLTSTLLASAAAALAAGPALAQDNLQTGAQDDVQEVIVTGSRIARNLVASTPVQVVGQMRLESQGYENVTDVLTTMPQFAPSFGTSRTQSTFSGQVASGLNLTNLRNLGPERSVTLINGRRVPAGTPTGSAVDFNMLPSANIDRLEILTGGASAIYGADATAGVVNVITDRRLRGVEIGASYGMALEHRDNINPAAYARIGVPHDRGWAGITLQYEYQGLVRCADREICAEDFFWSPPNDPIRGPAAYSGVPAGGRFFVGNTSYTLANGQVVPFQVAQHGYNRNAQRTLAIPTDRILMQGETNFRLFEGVNLFAEVNYARIQTEAPFEAHPFQSNADTFGALEPSIPVNNPFVPQALRDLAIAAGQTEITWWQRFNQLEDRGADNIREMQRGTVGLEGRIPALFGAGTGWSWELSWTEGRNDLRSRARGLVSLEALYQGLRVEQVSPGVYRCVDPAARAAGCVPINPFDGFTQAEQDYLVRRTNTVGRHDQRQGLAYVSGDIFNLPAGAVQAALGYEHRRVRGFLDYAEEINLGTTTGNQIEDTPQTTLRTNETFVELVVPVLANMPFFERLEFEGAYRWSESNRFDNYETWRYGGTWTPFPGIRFRAMQNRSVREPTVGTLSGRGQTFGVVADPCINWGASTNQTLRNNCQAAGIPQGYSPPVTVQQGVGGFVGGNPDLQPEVADTLTYGVVLNAGQTNWAPDWLRGFTVTLDRFEIDFAGLISTIGRQNVANLCYTLAAPERDPYCAQLRRGTDPAVPGANYVLTEVDDLLQNVASLDLRGWDFEVTFATDVQDLLFFRGRDWGSLTLSTVWTVYDEATQVNFPGATPLNLLGFAGGSTSDQGWIERQGNVMVNWRLGNLSTTWNSRYIGESQASPFVTDPARQVTIDSVWYHDAQVRWFVGGPGGPGEVYLGVRNIFDKDPPFFPSGTSGTQALDTVPAYFDVFGRSAYVGFRARF